MIVKNPEIFPFNNKDFSLRLLARELTSKYRVFYDKQEKRDTILCLTCGALSYHPQDVEYRYCGNCHKFHNDEQGHRGNGRRDAGRRDNGNLVTVYDEQGRQREGRLIMEDDRGRCYVSWPDSSQPGGTNGDWFEKESISEQRSP